MTRNQRLARLFRALSGDTQEELARKAGVHPVLLAQYELGRREPGPENLERLARQAGLTVEDGVEILRLADTLGRSRQRAGQGLDTLAGELASLVTGVYRRALRLPPIPSGGGRVEVQWLLLKDLPEDQRLAVVQVAREFQTPALAQRVYDESMALASRDPEGAAALARLAREIGDRVRG